ncbi:MAG: hypothetical protein ACOC9B_00960 [Chloroflexota bacterium]
MQLCREVMELARWDRVPEPDADRAEASDAVEWVVTVPVPAPEGCVYAPRAVPNSLTV